MTQNPDSYLGMGMTAENVAQQYKVTRAEQDQFALDSNLKSCRAIKEGLFKSEITSVKVSNRFPADQGQVEIRTTIVENDEGPRADSTMESLAKLKPAFLSSPLGTVTAGNSSQMSDGAAACLVCSEEFVTKHGLKPMARLAGFSVAGVAPRIMGIGPIEAIPKALKLADVNQSEITRIELNEAFAAQALAVLKTLKIDSSLVNPTGGAIALGHPLGATGAKLTATLLHGMRRDKQKWGIVSMCIGTGMGAAGVFEAL